MSRQHLRIIDLLTWTTLVAILFASFTVAPLMDPPNSGSLVQLLTHCMIASIPLAFIVSLIRQPILSPQMWTSFLSTVLLASWVGFLSAVIPSQKVNFQGLGILVVAAMGMIVSMFTSYVAPWFIGSLRKTSA